MSRRNQFAGVLAMTPDRHARELMQAAVNAGIFPPDETIDAIYDPIQHGIQIGPYAIPGNIIMKGIPATVQFMLMAKATAEIARMMADSPVAANSERQHELFAAARASLGTSASDPGTTTLYGTHYDVKVPDVYGASEVDEWGVRRMSDWIQTYTGRQFFVRDPRPEEIDIEDIAHALSLVNRYTGHTAVAYSVAEHSVRVMQAVRDLVRDTPIAWKTNEYAHTRLLLAALLHDGSEAYLADIARPIKMIPEMAFYRELEKGLEEAIAKKWNLEFPWPKIVKRADEILLVTEKRDLMGPSPKAWIIREEPLTGTIRPWAASMAEYRFLQEYRLLMDRINDLVTES